MKNNFNAEVVKKELRERYNIEFVDLFIQHGFSTYLFGGSPRDMVLGKDWMDADIQAWIPLPPKERDEKAEELLKKAHIDIKSKIIYNEKFTIYRFLPSRSKSKRVIDFTVVTKQFGAIPDFTIDGLYFDFGEHELIDLYGALKDIEHKIIRTILDPMEQLTLEPRVIFRAVKYACEFDFLIEKKTLEAMKTLSHLSVGALESIVDKKIKGKTEWYVDNVFKGLKYNPTLFVTLWNDIGLTSLFVSFIATRLNLSSNPVLLDNALFQEDKKYEYEEALSTFISAVAKKIDCTDSYNTFNKIVKLFHLDTPSVYGDFVIEIKKITYS